VSEVDFTAHVVGGAGGAGGSNGLGGRGITYTAGAPTLYVPAGNGDLGDGGAGGDASVTVDHVQFSASLVTLSLSAAAGQGGAAGVATATPALAGKAGADGTARIALENSTFNVMLASNRGDTLTLGLAETNPLGGVALNAGAGGNLVFSGNSFLGDGSSTLKLNVSGGGVLIDAIQGQISINGSPPNAISGFRTFYLDSNDTIVVNQGITVFLSYDPDTLIVEAGHLGGIIYNANATDFILEFQGFSGLTLAQLQQDTTVSGGNSVITIDGQSLTLYGYTGPIDDTNTSIACFRRGTRIATARGEIEIEQLRIGDLARTATGALRPIIWIGHRRVDCRRHPDPGGVWPVRVCAHAFGDNVPARDLWLSPGHNIAWEGVLMPVCALANGRSIAHVECDAVEYWHVELDAHDLLLSEGFPSESYLDCGNRSAFANASGALALFPDFAPRAEAQTCLPLVKDGLPVDSARAFLFAREAAEALLARMCA
jgi:hypothetical protein